MELVIFGKNDQLQATYSWEKSLYWIVSVLQTPNSATSISGFLWSRPSFSLDCIFSPLGCYHLFLVLTPPNTALPIPAVLPLLLLLLSHSHPNSGRARVIIFSLQAPFKFSLFKFRISLPFVLALPIKLESGPEISLIKKKVGDILISIPAIILWPFVVSLGQWQVLTRDKYCPSADLSHLQQKGYTC